MRSSSWRVWLCGAVLVGLAGCVSPYRQGMDRGQRLGDAGKWDEAAEAYQQALRVRPGDTAAQAGLRVATWNRSRERAVRARGLLERGDAMGALRLAREALGIDSAVPETQAIMDEASRAALAGVEAREADGRLDEALAWAVEVRALDPASARAAEAEVRLRERIAREAYARADELVARQRAGNALLAFTRADQVRPGYRDASARAAALRGQLERELRFAVVVGPGAGSPLAPTVARGLLRWAPEPQRPLLVAAEATEPGARGVQVNPVLDPVTRTHDVRASSRRCAYVCGVDRIPNPEHAERTRRVAEASHRSREAEREQTRSQADRRQAERAADQAAAGAASARRVADTAARALAACRAQSGAARPSGAPTCRREDDAATSARHEADRARGQADAAAADLRRARDRDDEAANALRRARQQWDGEVAALGRTPALLEQERSCEHSYGVQTHTLTARAAYELAAQPLGSVRVEAPPSRELVARASDDTFAAEADRCSILAGGDPLSLPPDDEMDRRLIGDALAASRALVQRWYDDDAGSYDREARALADAGRAEEATEARVRHQLLTGTFRP